MVDRGTTNKRLYNDAHSSVFDVCEKDGISPFAQLFPRVPTTATATKSPTSWSALPSPETRLTRSNSVSSQRVRSGR